MDSTVDINKYLYSIETTEMILEFGFGYVHTGTHQSIINTLKLNINCGKNVM